MKKLERLAWVEEVFGDDCVLPYQACRSMGEIERAALAFEARGRTWGMRTDFPNGHTQGFNLPFLWKGSLAEAWVLHAQYGEELVYIVSENILEYRLNAVALKVEKDLLFVEWNEDPKIPQRKMYDRQEDVRRICVGPCGIAFPFGYAVRSINPEDAAWHRFDRVWDVLVHSDVDEATFSVRSDGKLVVW